MSARAVRSLRVELYDGTVLEFDLSRGQAFLSESRAELPEPTKKRKGQLQFDWTDYEIHWTNYKEE